jgi:hypothetical protein
MSDSVTDDRVCVEHAIEYHRMSISVLDRRSGLGVGSVETSPPNPTLLGSALKDLPQVSNVDILRSRPNITADITRHHAAPRRYQIRRFARDVVSSMMSPRCAAYEFAAQGDQNHPRPSADTVGHRTVVLFWYRE